jgi:hypothetical protein
MATTAPDVTGAAPITAGKKAGGSSANADIPLPILRRQVNSRLAFSL